MGKTVRTHDDEEDFGEDFHIIDHNAKAKRHRLAQSANKHRKVDKWKRLESNEEEE